MDSVTPKASALLKDRLNDYLNHYKNEIVDLGEGEILAAFVQSIKRHLQLKKTSCVTYCKLLLPIAKNRWPNRDLHVFQDYIKGLKLTTMTEVIKRALDITLAFAVFIIQETRCPLIQADLWKLTATGGRFQDLARARDLFILNDTQVVVKWSLTKTQRDISQRSENCYEIPECLMPYRFGIEFPKLPTQPNMPGKVMQCTYRKIMTRLNRVVIPAQHADQSVTTYSFRRCFIQRCIAEHRNEKGIVDWDAVCQLTNHKNATIPKNVYAISFGTNPIDGLPRRFTDEEYAVLELHEQNGETGECLLDAELDEPPEAEALQALIDHPLMQSGDSLFRSQA